MSSIPRAALSFSSHTHSRIHLPTPGVERPILRTLRDVCAWCDPLDMREAVGGCVRHVRVRVNCACDGSGGAGDEEEERDRERAEG